MSDKTLTVVPMKKKSLPEMLREVARELEDGVYGDTDEATLIFPGAAEVFHMGGSDGDAPTSAMFNMNCGITKFTMAVLESQKNDN